MKMENDLGRDDIGRLVWRIAIPSMLAQFVSVLYSIVDRIYIGNIPKVGDIALAGVGVCGPVVTLVGSVAFLVGIGGSPLMSISMGEKNMRYAERILANCFLMLCVLSAVLVAVIFPLREMCIRDSRMMIHRNFFVQNLADQFLRPVDALGNRHKQYGFA